MTCLHWTLDLTWWALPLAPLLVVVALALVPIWI